MESEMERERPDTGATSAPLHALCVARHCFLSEHIARYFAEMGVVTTNAVGIDSAEALAGDSPPDVVICDYDVLANVPLEGWERNPLLSGKPVIAVSLTRRAEELHLFDLEGIAANQTSGALLERIASSAFAYAREAGIGLHRDDHVALIEERIEVGRTINPDPRNPRGGQGGKTGRRE
jgi:hypothetical protein